MSYNPFLATKVNTLKEAFPTVDSSVLENTLWLENGDMNKTFERLLAITDPSAALDTAPEPPLRTTQNSTIAYSVPSNPSPFTHPSDPSSQQRPLPTLPARAKPNVQSVREELAQWRQELGNERDMRRTDRQSSRRHFSRSVLRPSTASNYEMQSSYKDIYSLRDVVNEGSAAALKAATNLYDRFLTSNSVYGSYTSPSSSQSSSTYAYHQNNNTSPNLYSRSSSSSSVVTSFNRPSLPSSVNRPLPSPPQQSTRQDHTSNNGTAARNPFDSSDQADALPPPTYEAREHDTLIDPMDADHLLTHQTPSHSS